MLCIAENPSRKPHPLKGKTAHRGAAGRCRGASEKTRLQAARPSGKSPRRATTARQSPLLPQTHPYTCMDAMKEPGRVQATGTSLTATLAIGWTFGRGSWKNLQTGATGRFTTAGFTAGLGLGASGVAMTYTSMAAFTGMSDGWTAGVAFGLGDSPLSAGASYSESTNSSGGGTGGSADLGAASLPGAALYGSTTDTQISQCKPGPGSPQ
jgi:hypothetical protein